MKESFELPVQFSDKTILLPAELTSWGYSHRILVALKAQVIIFEPDEEGMGLVGKTKSRLV